VDDHARISAQVIHPNVGLRKLSTNLQNQLAQPTVLTPGDLHDFPIFLYLKTMLH